MKPFSRYLVLSMLAHIAAGPVTLAQFPVEVATDPAEARFVYTDVHNSLTAIDIIAKGHDPVEAMQELLSIVDPEAFLDRSAYRDRFAQPEG